jgi:membrane-associated protein
MDLRTYALFSTIGGVVWATGVTLLGYYLGGIPFVKDHIELILIGIVALSIIPIGFETFRHRRESRAAQAGAAEPAS